MTLLKLTPAMGTHRGMRRKRNEDAVGYQYPDDPSTLDQYGALFIVADGVGGLPDGDKASSLAVDSLIEHYYAGDADQDAETRLALAIQQVNDAIFKQLKKQGATTIIAVVITGETLIAGAVGDSLVFRVREDNITQLNIEDVLHDEQSVDDGALTKAIGYREEVDVQTISGTVATGDKILMCSDGLTRYLQPDQIARLANFRDPRDGVRRMINEANNQGGADNISAILIDIGAVVDAVALKDHIARLVVPVSIDAQPIFTPDVPSKPQTQIPMGRPEPAVPDVPITTPAPSAKRPTAVQSKPHTEPKPPPRLREHMQPPPPTEGNRLLFIGGGIVLALGALVLAFAFGSVLSSNNDDLIQADTAVPATAVQTSAPTAADVSAPTPATPATSEIAVGRRITLADSHVTLVRVGDDVASFVAAADTPYVVDQITEYEGQLWYRLLLEETEDTGWIAEADLPAHQVLQED